MKLKLLFLLSFVVLSTGCATVQPATATEADSAAAYMHTVENAAFGRAAKVFWVNPPRNKDLKKDRD